METTTLEEKYRSARNIVKKLEDHSISYSRFRDVANTVLSIMNFCIDGSITTESLRQEGVESIEELFADFDTYLCLVMMDEKFGIAERMTEKGFFNTLPRAGNNAHVGYMKYAIDSLAYQNIKPVNQS